jgi:hypothetical protein
VTTQKSEDLDYTEAESLKSRLADLFIFLFFFLFSDVFSNVVTHRRKAAHPEKK